MSYILDCLSRFFRQQNYAGEPISNERALQLELAFYFRSKGFRVTFERPFRVNLHSGQTRQQKSNLDLLLQSNEGLFGIELKVPLAGQVPEQMYAFCADVAFVESLVREKAITSGATVILTNDHLFWNGESNGIYRSFRSDTPLCGTITKPTGPSKTTVHLCGQYQLTWNSTTTPNLLRDARVAILEITDGQFNK